MEAYRCDIGVLIEAAVQVVEDFLKHDAQIRQDVFKLLAALIMCAWEVRIE